MFPDSCTYAIGDVHGRADLLKELLSAINKDSSDKHWTPRIIFLGDIIDHGPHSRSAMDLVCRTLKDLPGSRLILGNHDNFLLEFMTGANNRSGLVSLAGSNGWAVTKPTFRTDWKDSDL